MPSMLAVTFDRDFSRWKETEFFMKRRSKEKFKTPQPQRNLELKTKALDLMPAGFRKSYESLEPARLQLGPVGGRGGKKLSPHRIDEFHPRGAAGRRDIHGLTGPRKNALPNRGNRTKNPK